MNEKQHIIIAYGYIGCRYKNIFHNVITLCGRKIKIYFNNKAQIYTKNGQCKQCFKNSKRTKNKQSSESTDQIKTPFGANGLHYKWRVY